MNLFIVISVLILNIIAISAIFSALKGMETKKKLIITVCGIALVYLSVSCIYALGKVSIENEEIANKIRDYIVLAFVPINSIIVLPFLARTFNKYNDKLLDEDTLKRRIIIMMVIYIIILIVEFFYFKKIGQGILNIGVKQ